MTRLEDLEAQLPYLLLEYAYVGDYLERRGEFREEHLGALRAAAGRGELLMAGVVDEPPDRAVFVWTTADRSVVERFVEADPYVRHGLVKSRTLRPWLVAVGGDAQPAATSAATESE